MYPFLLDGACDGAVRHHPHGRHSTNRRCAHMSRELEGGSSPEVGRLTKGGEGGGDRRKKRTGARKRDGRRNRRRCCAHHAAAGVMDAGDSLSPEPPG